MIEGIDVMNPLSGYRLRNIRESLGSVMYVTAEMDTFLRLFLGVL